MKRFFKKILGIGANSSNQISEERLHKNVSIGLNSDVRKANFIIRNQNKTIIKVGEDCILESNFVIECEGGSIIIGDRSFIGGRGIFVCANNITIGSDVMFSWGCTVIDNDAHSLNWEDRVKDVVDWKKGSDEGSLGKYKNWDKVKKGSITIQDKAWIGFNVIILKDITIGEGAVVAAGSVVTKDVEPYTLVGGNPARFIKKLN